jgi:Mrp family chromosome partitioning ATPase
LSAKKRPGAPKTPVVPVEAKKSKRIPKLMEKTTGEDYVILGKKTSA